RHLEGNQQTIAPGVAMEAAHRGQVPRKCFAVSLLECMLQLRQCIAGNPFGVITFHNVSPWNETASGICSHEMRSGPAGGPNAGRHGKSRWSLGPRGQAAAAAKADADLDAVAE